MPACQWVIRQLVGKKIDGRNILLLTYRRGKRLFVVSATLFEVFQIGKGMVAEEWSHQVRNRPWREYLSWRYDNLLAPNFPT